MFSLRIEKKWYKSNCIFSDGQVGYSISKCSHHSPKIYKYLHIKINFFLQCSLFSRVVIKLHFYSKMKAADGTNYRKTQDTCLNSIWTVPKLFVQINIRGREHEKYILLWYIWSLKAISDARDDLHRRQFSMLIAAVKFTGTARMREHSSVCTQYVMGPLTVVSIRRFLACQQWYQQRG